MEVIVATLLSRVGPTGVQSHVREVSCYLSANSVRHEIVTPFDSLRALSYPLFAVRKAVERVAPALAIWLYRRGHAVFLRLALRRRTRSGQACVIYAQCPVSAQAALTSCRAPGQRVVMVVHFNESQADEWVGKGMLTPTSWLYRQIVREERATLQRVAGLVFVSRYMQARVLHRVPEIAVVHQIVVPNFIGAVPSSASAIPTFDVVSIGTLEPRKNQSFLLEVLAAARRGGHTFTLGLVGDGPDRQALERRARALGVDSQVTFLGRKTNAARYLARAKACVHSAKVENQGIVIIEALSAGLPVLAPAVGGIPELFDDGVEGRFWPLDDAEEAARLLGSILLDSDTRQRMSKAARRRFESAFGAVAMGGRLMSFLTEVSAARLQGREDRGNA